MALALTAEESNGAQWGNGRGQVTLICNDDTKMENVPHQLIALSNVWKTALDTDPSETKLQVPMDGNTLLLLLRFGALVIAHNTQRRNAVEPWLPLPQTQYTRKVVKTDKAKDQKDETETVKFIDDWKHRARHLPLVLNHDIELARFLDNLPALALDPLRRAAQRILMEPAESALLLKLGMLLDGMSLPMMYRQFPNDPVEATAAIKHALDATQMYQPVLEQVLRGEAAAVEAKPITKQKEEVKPAIVVKKESNKPKRRKPAPCTAPIVVEPSSLPSLEDTIARLWSC